MAKAKKNRVFISYSQKDRKWLKLVKHALAPYIRKNQLDIWDDSRIKAGDKWRDEINTALQHATVAVMLVSRNFLASDFIVGVELPVFLGNANKKGLRIIWIPIGECAIETTGLSEYQAAFDRPLNSLSPADLDKALVKIAQTIDEAARSADLKSQVNKEKRGFFLRPIHFVRTWPLLSAAAALLILIAIVYGGFLLSRKSPKAVDEVTILVADLDGPEDYKVTQALLARMRESVQNKIPNVRVIALARKITEQEGPEKAIQEGRKADANLVLWGYYNTSYHGKVHIEQIKTPEPLHLLKHSVDLNPRIAERKGITVEEDLSSELNYLILIVTGLTRFEVGAYRAAIDCYDNALKERSAPEQLLDQLQIYQFRGLAYLYLDAEESLEHFEARSGTEGAERFYLGGDPPNQNHYLVDQAIANFTTLLTSRPSDLSTLYWRAHGYARKGDYSNALNDYDRILQGSPNYVEAHIGRGIVHNLMEEFDHAIADYDKAASLEPNNEEVYYNRAISYEQNGDYEHALADYDHAISINRYDVDSKINRASLYANLGYYRKAVQELTNAFDGASPTAFDYSHRGRAWSTIGNDDNALADFTSMIGLAPDSAAGYHLRGHLLRDLKRYDEAISDFSKVCSIDPTAGYARNDLATCWVSKGNYTEALKHYSEATDIDPKWGFSWVNRGLAHWQTQDKEQALLCLTKSTEINFEDRYRAYYYLAQLKSEMGDYWGSIDSYASAIQLKPGFIDLWLQKASTWLKVQRYDTAMREYRTAFTLLELISYRNPNAEENKTYDAAIDDLTVALRYNPRNEDGYIARGLAYLLQKKTEDALTDIRMAITLDPKSAEGHAFQGTALIDVKRYEEARTSLNKAIELNPKLFRAFYSRAMAYVEEGQVTLAIEDLSQALAISPNDSLSKLNRGVSYAMKKDFPNAIADFDSIPADYEGYDRVLLFRGLANADVGNWERAKADLQRASNLARSVEVQQKAMAELVRLGVPIDQ